MRSSKEELMATSMTGMSISAMGRDVGGAEFRAHRRRQISQPAGRALEILGHAIEYLADEYVHEGGSISARDPRVEAVQLLMARNREVYFACPEVPTVAERVLGWAQRHSRFLFHRTPRQLEQ